MKLATEILAAMFVFLACSLAMAQVPDAIDGAATAVKDDPGGAFFDMVEAVRNGEWRTVAALVLSVIMIIGSKARDRVAVFSGRRGGAILLMVLSLAGAFSTTLLSGAPLDLQTIGAAFNVALIAAGGWHWVRDILGLREEPTEV